jgi:hypothetical protein
MLSTAAVTPVMAQEKTGGGTGTNTAATTNADGGSDDTGANGQDSNPGTAWNIRQNYMLRYPVAKEFGPSTAGGSDVIQNKTSQGPGVVVHSTSGPVYIWPYPVPTAISQTPTLRDQAIQKDLFQTFGLPVSDTQYQVISRYNDNRMLEQAFDPEKLMWLATATAGLQATSAANSQANMASNQSESAIDFTKKYLVNFTAEAGNRWQQIRDQLFIPMAILLLLPGAVLAQVRALVAQGSPVLGDVNPFEGILRSIVAIFLIPGTFLVINYGIDVSNSITYTIADEYQRIFGTDMYQDAVCAEQRALASNAPNSNLNALPTTNAQQQDATATAQQGQTVWNQYEALTLTTRKYDPCAGIDQQIVPDEQANWQKQVARFLTNSGNVLTTGTWNVMCAFQMAFLYYLWCMGPIAAALWVWPIGRLRGALPSWIEGVITVCFWSLFWNTIVLLMACFRGVGDSGIVIMSALNTLSIYAVQYAFDFSSLVSQGGAAGISSAMQGAMQNAQSAAGGGGAGGTAGAAGQQSKTTAGGGGAGALGHSSSSSAGLQQALHAASAQNFGSALMGNAGSSNAAQQALHTQAGGALGHQAVPPPLGTAGIQAALGQSGSGVGGVGAGSHASPPLSGAAAPGTMANQGIHAAAGTAGSAGSAAAGTAGALGHGTPPLSAQGLTTSGGGAGAGGAAGSAGNAAHGMALGASAASSTGLGLRMDANGNMHMNQEAMNKMQQQQHGQDAQKALQQAMQSAQHGDMHQLNDFMNHAATAGVLDSHTQSAITGMLHSGAAPTMDSHGGLHMDSAHAMTLAKGGEMPLTGMPAGLSGSSLASGGGHGSMPPSATATATSGHAMGTMGDASHMAKDSAGPLGPLHAGDSTSQMQGLHSLAQQEGMPNHGNFHLEDSHGNHIDPNNANAMSHVPPGEHLKAVADNGQQFASYNGHQWAATDAAGHANGVSLGGNGSWQAGNGVSVQADHSGSFSSTAGHYAYEPGGGTPGSGSFNVDGHHLAANSVSGDLLSSYSHGSASAHSTVDALSHSGVSENLNAAMHGDQAAQHAVQQGLQGTGVHSEDLARASMNGDQLASAHVMAQEAVASGHVHDMAHSLGVSDSTLANAATSHTAAGQVMAADAHQHSAYASDLHMPAAGAIDAQHSASFLAEAQHNPVAAAQLAGAQIAHDPGYAHEVAQSLGVHDSVVASSGHNAVAATQMMAAEASHNPDLARDVSPAMGGHVSSDMMSQAAHNPIAAAQVLGHDVQANPEYASMASHGLQTGGDTGHMQPSQMMAEAAHNPVAAASVVGMEAHNSSDYAGYVAQNLHMPSTELASQMGHNSVLAAQAVGAEAYHDHGYAQSVAAQMHTSPEAVMASASSPTLAAAMVGHQAEQSSAYAAHVSAETHMPQSMVTEAAHSPLAATHVAAAEAAQPGHESYASQVAGPMMGVAGTSHAFDVVAHSPGMAAQALSNEVAAHPEQAAQFAHAMGTSTETLQHAASSPIAAASVVAHDAQTHQSYGEYAAQSMHLSDASSSYGYASSHYVGAAQLAAADAAAHPAYGAHMESQLGVSHDLMTQAAHNPVAAAQLVAADAVHNPQTMHAVSEATHMTPQQIAYASHDAGAAAMLMAHDTVSHGSGGGGYDSGYAAHISSEMGVQPQSLHYAASSYSGASQLASEAAHTYAESYGSSASQHIEASHASASASQHIEASYAASASQHIEASQAASASQHIEASQASSASQHIEASQASSAPHHIEASQVSSAPHHIEASQVSSASQHSEAGYAASASQHIEASHASASGGGGYAEQSYAAQAHVAPVSDGAGHYAAGITDSSGHFVSAMSDGHGHYVAAVSDSQGHMVPAHVDQSGHYVAADAHHPAQQVGAVQDPQHPGHLIAAVQDASHPGHVAAAIQTADGSYVAAAPDSSGGYVPVDMTGHSSASTYTPSSEVAQGGGGAETYTNSGYGSGGGETYTNSGYGSGSGETYTNTGSGSGSGETYTNTGSGSGSGETFSEPGHGHHHVGGGYDPSANPGSYVPHATNLPDYTVAHQESVPQDLTTASGGGQGVHYTPDSSPQPEIVQPAPQVETGTYTPQQTLGGVLGDVYNNQTQGTSSSPPVSWDTQADTSQSDPGSDPSVDQGAPMYIADRQAQPNPSEIGGEIVGGVVFGSALGRAIGNAGTPPPRQAAPQKPQQQAQTSPQQPSSGSEEPGHTGHLQGQLKPQGSVNKMNKKRYRDMMAELEQMPGQHEEEEEEET